MSRFSEAVGRSFSGGAKSFAHFPAAMFSALIVAISAAVLVHLEFPDGERLFSSLMLSYGCMAFAGMAAAAVCGRFWRGQLPFVLLNILPMLIGGGLFAYLYLLPPGDIPSLVVARLLAASLAAFIIFLLAISADPGRSDFTQVFFMALKSLAIALVYALILLLGLFFVAFTIESLIYDDLSEKVYQYIAIGSAFVGFAFFLGYFPRFRKDMPDERLDAAQKQPVFAEILFVFVLVPVMLAMTAVLLVWAVQSLAGGNWREFRLLGRIFAAYSLTGIFLSYAISHNTRPLAVFYRRAFPFAAMLFLAFEAYAFYRQASGQGIRPFEYFTGLIWIFALFAIIVLMGSRPERNRLSAWLALALTILSVLPLTGYQPVSVGSQTGRLQAVLIKNDMIVDGEIVRAPASISLADRITITDAAGYLSETENRPALRAPWLVARLGSPSDFQDVFGFAETYSDYQPGEDIAREITLLLPDGALEIGDYEYIALASGKDGESWTIAGSRGTYEVVFLNMIEMDKANPPAIEIHRDGEMVLRQSLAGRISELADLYGASDGQDLIPSDMTLPIEVTLADGQLRVLVIFQSIVIQVAADDNAGAYLIPAAVCLAES